MLKGLGICCLGSMRMILFFICMVAALGQLISLSIGLFSDPNKLNLGEDLDFGPTAIIGSLLFLIIFICGAYGTFNSHERSMRFFAGAMIGYTTVSALKLVYIVGGNNLSEMIRRIFERRMSEYDWKSSDSEKNMFVDLIQMGQRCCGYKGPGDWDQYRPRSRSYPFSCCRLDSRSEQCDSSRVYQDGCEGALDETARVSLYVLIAMLGFQVAVCVMAAIVAFCKTEKSQVDRQVIVTTNSSGFVDAPIQYQRLDGSVYVRQPPNNAAYKGAQIEADSNGMKFTPPPPNYGA